MTSCFEEYYYADYNLNLFALNKYSDGWSLDLMCYFSPRCRSDDNRIFNLIRSILRCMIYWKHLYDIMGGGLSMYDSWWKVNSNYYGEHCNLSDMSSFNYARVRSKHSMVCCELSQLILIIVIFIATIWAILISLPRLISLRYCIYLWRKWLMRALLFYSSSASFALWLTFFSRDDQLVPCP